MAYLRSGLRKRLKETAAFILVAAIVLFLLFRPKGDISDVDARALVEKGATLLDVRTPEEFSTGHVDGATNIPVGVLASRLAEVPRDKPVVLYCRSGTRSARAASMLRDRGYVQVHDVGPMPRW